MKYLMKVYGCSKCKKLYEFRADEQYSTKCSKCHRELIYSYDYNFDTESEHKEVKTVPYEEMKARLYQSKNNSVNCPNCNSVYTNKISTSKKIISTSLLGLASSTIGKTYECKTCGYKW